MRRFIQALCLVFLLPPLLARAASPVSVDLSAFQQQLAETLEANDVPGAGIALIQDGEVTWAGGIGYARLDPEQHAISATRFRIGSVTKIFTALAVLRLVEEGRLSLDRPVHEIAPEVPITNPWRAAHPVTVAQLLEHTAGFDDMHFRNMNTDEPLPASLHETLLRLDDELEVRWQPGVKHSYSNPGYAVAGYLVEKISGQPFHEYIDRNVLAPLGMETTVWGVSADKHFAQGYVRAGVNSLRPVESRSIRLYPAGELSASSADLARVVQFFLKRGDGAWNKEFMDRMERSMTTRAAWHGLENGYGLGNYTSFRNGFRLQGHNGGLDGFSAALAYSKEHNFGYVVLINRADSAALKVLEDQATAFLTQNIESREPGALDKPSAQLPETVVGCYRMTNSRNELLRGFEWLVQVACVETDSGGAVAAHPIVPEATRLVPVGDALLRQSDMVWPTAVFMSGDDFEDALQWSGIYFERASRLGVTAPLLLALLAQLLMASAVLFFPVWAIRWWRGRLRSGPAIAVRAWPLIASALLVFTFAWALRLELSLLDSVNAITVGIFFGGILFALASFYALYCVMREWNSPIHPVAKWHSLLVATACTGIALYLIYWRLIPLRLWAW